MFQQQTTTITTTSTHKIRRAPVQQNVSTVGFPHGAGVSTLNQPANSLSSNTPNYFQQELQFQQQNQPQTNQFRFQNANIQFSQVNSTNNVQAMPMQQQPMGNQAQPLMGSNPDMIASSQMGQSSNRGIRGGRGGMVRGGGVNRRGGQGAGGPAGTANRGARQNF